MGRRAGGAHEEARPLPGVRRFDRDTGDFLPDDLPRAADGRLHQEHGAADPFADARPDRGLGVFRGLLVGSPGCPRDPVLRRQAGGSGQPLGALPARSLQARPPGGGRDHAQDHPVALRQHFRSHVLLGDHHPGCDPQLGGNHRQHGHPGGPEARGTADRRRQERHCGVPGGGAFPAARRENAPGGRVDRRARQGAAQRVLFLQSRSARIDRQDSSDHRAGPHGGSRRHSRLGDALRSRADLRRHQQDQGIEAVPSKRLCYFTSQRVTAYLWTKGELHKEGVFDMSEKGVAEYSRYVAGAPGTLFYVRAADRRALLARKLAQRYRDASLALPLSLGSETHAGRREERILYMSFTNTQLFQPWLEALRSNHACVVGVFSVALVAAQTGKRLGFKGGRYLMVSRQQAGLRQSYIENGRIRFSRLGRVDFSDPRVIAQDYAAESLRIQQYLVNSRILPREAPALDVLVLAPSEHKALYDAACVDSARLQFHVHDLDKVAGSLGLKSAPPETLAEGLFLHVLAAYPSREQYADERLRRFYHLWRARVALLATGAAAFAFCLLLSAVRLLDIHQVNEQAQNDRVQEARASEEYARLQKRFPKTPISSETLKTVVKNYRALLRQSASPGRMFTEISEAVTALPQIEIDRIDWEFGTGAKSAAGREASKAPSTPPAGQAQTAGTEFQTQTAEIAGKLVVPQASDFRAVIALVNQFTEALRRRPGTEVTRTQLPFDINAEKSLAGDIGAARREEVPQFSVVVVKRRGT